MINPKNKKSVLILIIILMIIVIPSAIWGTVSHITSTAKPVESNSNKDLYYNGKLYFYNLNTLVGTYTCTSSVCDYAYNQMDDSKYMLNYHQVQDDVQIKMINNKYAFIVDSDSITAPYTGSKVTLYDITGNRTVGTFTAVKNYGVGLENNEVILQNTEGLWGVIALSDSPSLMVPYVYNYIGVHDIIANNDTALETDSFVVNDASGWKIINKNNVNQTGYYTNPIYDYNSNYVIVYNNGYYFLYDYSNKQVITFGYNKMKFMGEYIGVLNTSNQFYIINPKTTEDISKRYNVNSIDDVTYVVSSSGITISINGTEMETVS